MQGLRPPLLTATPAHGEWQEMPLFASSPSRPVGLCLSSRLIKGDGEVLEEIVSKERHKEINKVARTCHRRELLLVGGWVGTAGKPLHPGALPCLPGDLTPLTLPGQNEPWQPRRGPTGGCWWSLTLGRGVLRVPVSLPLQQATRGDGLAFQARTGMLQ